MNNRPVDQALATLLPTHANDIPPELRNLALSFVAQSRSFSTSLKPDEEIARPFACGASLQKVRFRTHHTHFSCNKGIGLTDVVVLRLDLHALSNYLRCSATHHVLHEPTKSYTPSLNDP
jgi:hypothetical protein